MKKLFSLCALLVSSMCAINAINLPLDTTIQTNFAYPLDNEAYYDVDGDGMLELIGGFIEDIDWSSLSLARWETDALNQWWELNNDGRLDGYTEKSNSVDLSDTYSWYSMDNSYKLTASGTNIHPSANLLLFDYNNDGYPDVVAAPYSSAGTDVLLNDRAYTMMPSADAVVENTVEILTIDEYKGKAIHKNHSSLMTTAGLGSALSSVSASEAPLYRAMSPNSMDVNGDGIVDYFEKGQLYTSMGNGTIVYQTLAEGIDFVELNGDGIMDGVAFDGSNVVIYILKQDGTYTTQKIFTSTQYSTLWAYDFDKDEDKDILLAYNYSNKLAGSFLILLENLGDNNYTSHEYFYEDTYDFGYCVDYDSDGRFEIIASIGNERDNSLCSIEIDSTTIASEPVLLNIKARNGYNNRRYYHVADVDNDGTMELFAQTYATPILHLIRLSGVVNGKPAQPQAPTLVYDEAAELLSITWSPTTDKESSSVDLTYALRIGTAPGKGDILFAHALPDGTRRNRMGGNQATNRYRLLNTKTWAAGKYYISVQAVDPNNRGSLFSEEVVFEKTTHAAAMELLYTSPFGIGDTCTVHLHPNTLLDSSLAIQVTNGEVVNMTDDKLTYYVVFSAAGEQTISLGKESNNGALVIANEKSITVVGMKQHSLSNSASKVSMDMDEDGQMEYYVDGEGFYSYNGEVDALINKMWNRHTYITDASYSQKDYTADINKDGKCDVFANYSQFNSTSWYTMINQGNKAMAINDELIDMGFYISYFSAMVDINNDGFMDIVHDNSSVRGGGFEFLKNDGTYRSFTCEGIVMEDVLLLQDLTNDGLVDCICENSIDFQGSRTHAILLLQNNGDFTFTTVDTLLTNISYVYNVADFDNDGHLDFIGKENSNYCVYWSDGKKTILEGITEIEKRDIENQTTFDFNNDGYLDIYAEGGLLDSKGILLFGANHTYEFVSGFEFSSSCIPFPCYEGMLRIGSKLLRTDNTSPAIPEQVCAAQGTKGVTITWNDSKDAETPAVHMRYNISIKQKGKSGDGAYLISPCNSTKNGVRVPSILPLLQSNQLFIPTTSIPVGEYEVQVQAIDLQGYQSDFSEVCMLVVKESVAIEAPARTGMGIETEVEVISNVANEIDWAGGRVVEQTDNHYRVVWDSEGVKTITAGEHKQAILVVALPSSVFTLPSHVIKGATVYAPADNAKLGSWSALDNQQTAIQALGTDSVKIVFTYAGECIVRHIIPSEFGNAIYDQTVWVTDSLIAPEIAAVTNLNGHYQIIWNNTTALPEDVIGYRLYKESNHTNDYDLIAELGIDDNQYVDETSNPAIQSSRYAMSYVTTYGEGRKCTPHQGLHVMINRGIGTTWNLAWMKYEGRPISQYRIWRGTTQDNLALIGEISGNTTSFSDLMTGDSVNYYAVEVVFTDNTPSLIVSSPLCPPVYRGTSPKGGGGSICPRASSPFASNISPFSNVVSTAHVNEVTFVEHIDVQGKDIIAGENTTSQIYAYMRPYYATYKMVNFVIVQGDDIATIDATGVLTANGYSNGDVVVRAYALDGSNIYGETTINVRGFDNTFTVTYMVDGEVVHTEDVPYGSPLITPDSIKEGYSVVWHNVPHTMPAHDILINGTFVIKMYALSYYVDNEWYATDSVAYNDTIELREEPIKAGHLFSGWSETPKTMPAHDVQVVGTFTVYSATENVSTSTKNNRKAIKDNQLYIILPNGNTYSVTGKKL